MRALQLDYQRTYRPVPWLGLGVLVAALVVLALMGCHYQTLKQQIALWEGKVAQIQGPGRPDALAPRPLTEQAARAQRLEAEQANQVLRQLALPWSALFNAVESSGGPGVALLSLEPELHKGVVKISGEAKDFKALLDYVRQLAAQPVFDRVMLQSHQIAQADPQKPVRFTLLAHWKESAP